jgi:hypothetical protein
MAARWRCIGPVRSFEGEEVTLPTWTGAQAGAGLAANLMLINVSMRKLRRAVRLPEGDLRAIPGDGRSRRHRGGSWRCRSIGWPNG